MNLQAMKTLSHEIETVMPWVQGIQSHEQYLELLTLMEALVEDYDSNQALVNILFPIIEQYEEESEYFREFNERIEGTDKGVALLRVLIDQHRLTLSDLPEIGGKSLVSMILKGKRALTIPHIKALSARFGVSPYKFV